jgi:hypothetical protein
MIADTWLLLTLRWHLAWNAFRARKTGAKVLYIVGSLVVAGFALLLSGSAGILAGVALRQFADAGLDTLLPGLILTGTTFLILLGSFGVALGSLFLSSDLDLLMTAPVDRRAVFISKILDGMAFYYLVTAVVALPALLTYGVGMGYGPLYYLCALLTALAVPLFPASVAAILVILVARFAPARRVREVLGLVGALFGLTCGLLGQTSRFWFRGISGSGETPEHWLVSLRGLADWPVPSMVAGRGLGAAGAGDLLGALAGLAGFLAITFGLFAGCVILADNLYAVGWVRMQSSGSAKRTRQRAQQAATRRGLLSRASAVSAIILKDWRVIPRDLRNFAQMLAPLLFLPVIYLNIIGGGRGAANPLGDLLGKSVFDPAGVFVAAGILFASAAVFGRIADTSISREGKSWWLLKAAPVSAAEIVRSKFLAAFIPFCVLSTVLMVGAEAWKGFSLLGFLYGLFGVLVLGAGMMAIETGLAVPWARLDWDDPRRMSSGWGAIGSLIAWALLGTVGGGALCLPIFAQAANSSLTLWAILLGMVLASAVSLGSGYAALAFGVSRLGGVGET